MVGIVNLYYSFFLLHLNTVMKAFVLHRLAKKCTKIYNAYRTIVRLIKPFVLRLFRCRCGLYKVPAVVVYKKSRCRHISLLFASIFAI